MACPFLCQQFLPTATTGELLPLKPLACSSYDVSRDAFEDADGVFTAALCQRCRPPGPENGGREKEKLVVNRLMQVEGELVTAVQAASKETLASKTEYGLPSTVTVCLRPARTTTRTLEESSFPLTLS